MQRKSATCLQASDQASKCRRCAEVNSRNRQEDHFSALQTLQTIAGVRARATTCLLTEGRALSRKDVCYKERAIGEPAIKAPQTVPSSRLGSRTLGAAYTGDVLPKALEERSWWPRPQKHQMASIFRKSRVDLMLHLSIVLTHQTRLPVTRLLYK